MKTFKNAFITAIVGSLVGFFAHPIIEQQIQSRKTPVLVKEVYKPNISTLPSEIRKQVSLIPIKYSLQHKIGTTAKNITILIISSKPLSADIELTFSPDSEAHSVVKENMNRYNINVPLMRPGGIINFDMLVRADNDVKIQELIEDGKILDTGSFKAYDKSLANYWLIGGGIFWALIMIFIGIGVWKIRNYWCNSEVNPESKSHDIRKSLITLIAIIYIYQIIVFSTGPLIAFLPLPRVSFTELFYIFSFYLLVTRYKLIERTLEKFIDKK